MSEREKSELSPKFRIEGKKLKIQFPQGHFFHNNGYEYIILCEQERAPNDAKALDLLKKISDSLEKAWKKMAKIEEMDNRTSATGMSPNPVQEKLLQKLRKEMQAAFLFPISLMNKSGNINISAVVGAQKTSNQFDIVQDDAYSTSFAYGGLINTTTNKRYVLSLDSDLKFNFTRGRGIKYTALP